MPAPAYNLACFPWMRPQRRTTDSSASPAPPSQPTAPVYHPRSIPSRSRIQSRAACRGSPPPPPPRGWDAAPRSTGRDRCRASTFPAPGYRSGRASAAAGKRDSAPPPTRCSGAQGPRGWRPPRACARAGSWPPCSTPAWPRGCPPAHRWSPRPGGWRAAAPGWRQPAWRRRNAPRTGYSRDSQGQAARGAGGDPPPGRRRAVLRGRAPPWSSSPIRWPPPPRQRPVATFPAPASPSWHGAGRLQDRSRRAPPPLRPSTRKAIGRSPVRGVHPGRANG